MPVELLVRAILVISLALFASACGGGGGGGSDALAPADPTPVDPTPVDPAPVDPAPVDPAPVDPAPFTATQNRLLPLTAGTTTTYSDGTNLTVEVNAGLSDSNTTVYAVRYNNMTQYFSSTPEQVLLHGVDGTFSLPDINAGIFTATNVSFDNVRFNPPLPIIKANQTIGVDQIENGGIATATVSANINGNPTPTVAPNIPANIADSSYSSEFLTQIVNTPIGIFAAKDIRLEITLSGSVLGLPFTSTLTDRILLAPGLGIVQRSANYSSGALVIDHSLSSLTNLPHPVTFTKTLANPTPSIPEDTVENTYDQDAIFSFSGGTDLSSELYEVANMADINTAGWINITENTTNNNFSVDLLVNDNTPTSSTSQLVVFRHKTSGKEIPASLNLIVN